MTTSHQRRSEFTFEGECYRLTLAAGRPFVYLHDALGNPLAELFVLSAVHPLHGRDDTTSVSPWQISTSGEETVLALRARSSIWDEKVYRFRCRPHSLTYEIEVVGAGQLAEVHPFGGYYSGSLRWGSGFFHSGHEFQRAFNPEPHRERSTHFPATENASINLTGVPLPGRGDWFFTPPPFCFAFEHRTGWLGLGLAARAGENLWSEYRYVGQRNSFYLTLDYEGYTQVRGRYILPSISFQFAADEYGALAKHVHALREEGLVPITSQDTWPTWWREPIFCGWGAQSHLAAVGGGHPTDYAQQHRYDEFLVALERQRIGPGIIVLDDKWQATYGENRVDEQKWPDLRRFVDEQHDANRKVLLWLKAWDPEGVPASECITNAAGLPVTVDPTNPAYERRFRASVRQMLSPDGYDADGFKIDFSARIPSGPGMHRYGDAWGLELMKQYLSILYDEAKRSKPDALIMTHTPHPYLADVLDVIRLNDMIKERDVPQEMRHRARVVAIACPDALIDTDNWPVLDRETWRTYLPLQAELGVPSLYYTSHVDETGEVLEEADFDLIREAWAAYRASLVTDS